MYGVYVKYNMDVKYLTPFLSASLYLFWAVWYGVFIFFRLPLGDDIFEHFRIKAMPLFRLRISQAFELFKT